LPEILDLPLEERALKALEAARTIGYLEPQDTKVCVISSSKFAGAGYFTGIYDLAALQVHMKAPAIKPLRNKGGRASMI
jgi:hypothetical protein